MLHRHVLLSIGRFIYLIVPMVSVIMLPLPGVQANDTLVLHFLKLDANPAWEQAAAAFAAQDADVSQVVLLNVQDGFEHFDCSLADQFREWRWQYADLTSLVQADTQFNPADLFPGALESVTSDGLILGYPLAISPDVIRFDVEWLNRMGVPLPTSDWTTADFVQTLQMLRPDASTPAPFGIRSFPPGVDAITHLVMADSALPVDTRTQPPTLGLDQPETAETIRRVLDLARNGFVEFPQSSPYSGQPVGFNAEDYPIWSDALSGGTWAPNPNAPRRQVQTVLYPRGTRHAPVSYRVMSGYVHQSSQHQEVCYRWFKYLATRPDVIGIPARMSQAQPYALNSGQGETFLSFYMALWQRASDAASRLPQHNYPSQFLAHINVRLDRAYREYIFDGIPLETAMLSAQQDTKAYIDCISVVPSSETIRQMSQTDAGHYAGIIRECRRSYVPEIMWMYGVGGARQSRVEVVRVMSSEPLVWTGRGIR